MRVDKCRACGAPIVWQVTRGGKATPADAVLDPEGGQYKVMGSHWRTCPDAAKFRGAYRVRTKTGDVGLQPRLIP